MRCMQVQKEHLDNQVRQLSNSHIVYPGITRQKRAVPHEWQHPHQKVLPAPVPLEEIPGVKEAGWSKEAEEGPR